MGQELGDRKPLRGSKPKKWTKQPPSSQELAEQYFDLKYLRECVDMAETNRSTDRKVLSLRRSLG
jgi:hypothetical protein